ncbi:ABC transporter ATP-binding protein [Alicyclobacillus mengziensis]|uniref:ABC transporter ATP-binding protein n=1 Tax=Alicyclobacillus mengziensis TaxID=2931921 RepID=A0A9X7VYZ5_9BACL|nr:ABC transporter ATP-binding protein [Alicyclobacillus mengziensis]QSO47668.1 ABC transporter ATP-binding protein [Alicyclobacillus mengziensis]
MIVDLRDVSWRQQGRTIVSELNWRIEPGQHWALIGPNGSGKTSLLNMILGYQWPTKGQISVLGQRYGACDMQAVRKSIAYVSSSLGARFHASHGEDSARDVVKSGKHAAIGVSYHRFSDEDEMRAEAMLDSFGCLRLADRPFRQLSQGEQQKVLLARAWMGDPDLIILDEPCTGLDVGSRENLLGAISALAAQSSKQSVRGATGTEGPSAENETTREAAFAPTMIYVTHHVEEVLPVFTHALVLKFGECLAAGEKRTVLTDDNLTRAFEVPCHIVWANGRPWLTVV